MKLLTVEEEDSNLMPWSAAELDQDVAMVCRQCHASLLPPRRPFVWKDLPSEHWAEMMEFWHCHKPHDHSSGATNPELAKKGYSASNRIAARTGCGLIDLSSFLLATADCENIKVRVHNHKSYYLQRTVGSNKEKSISSNFPVAALDTSTRD